MKIRLVYQVSLLVLLSTLLLATGCYKPPGNSSSTHAQKLAQLKGMIENEWMWYMAKHKDWQGSICLQAVTAGEEDYFVSAGEQPGAGKGHHFRAAATTKTFTAAAILYLQQNEKLHINDTITQLIPGTDQSYIPHNTVYDIPFKDKITIKQLLGHRAGVFDVSESIVPDSADASYAGKNYVSWTKEQQPEHTFTIDEQVGVAAEHQLSYFEPGSGFHYSNTGYSLLGKIIERVSGQAYHEFIRESFFEPNNLSESSLPYDGNDVSLPKPYFYGYLWTDQKLSEVSEDNISAHVAHGNLITTTDDLATWAYRLYRGESGLAPEYIEMMMDVRPTGNNSEDYGLGTAFTEDLGYGHNGSNRGYVTVMRYDPDKQASIVVTCSFMNTENPEGQFAFMYNIGHSALDILFTTSNE
ncbi:MAG: beta-lactamase family protein [Bacteroidales bacterium]|nr:beta-lactamase family protein [Bacteroidales bacterium]